MDTGEELRLEAALLDRLADQLNTARPGLARQVAALGRNAVKYIKSHPEAWERWVGAPVGPEPGLLTAILDVRWGIDLLSYCVERSDGEERERMVMLFAYPVFHAAALERIEVLLKRLARAGFITSASEERLALKIAEAREDRILGLRHQVAHSHRVSAESVAAALEKGRYWEMIAVLGLGPRDSHGDSPLEWWYRRENRWAEWKDANAMRADEVRALMADVCRAALQNG